MKLKKILQDNDVNLREHYYEEALFIKSTTPKEVLDLVLSSDEFNCVEEIKSFGNEDLKNSVTLLLTDDKRNYLLNLKLKRR